MPKWPLVVSRPFRFCPFELDRDARTLTQNRNRVKLLEPPYRLLLMVVERAGEIVSCEALRQQLCPTTLSSNLITAWESSVKEIRDALGHDAGWPCDHSVTSADVRLSVGKKLEIVNMFSSKTKKRRFEQPKLLGISLSPEIRDSAPPTRGSKMALRSGRLNSHRANGLPQI